MLILVSCTSATKKSELPEGTVLTKVTYMNPSPKICELKRTVTASDLWAGEFKKVTSDIDHLAFESKANVARVIEGSGVYLKAELFSCPVKYVNDYLNYHYEDPAATRYIYIK